MTTRYSIVHNLEYKDACDRCGIPLCHGVRFIHEGKLMLVGRECAKHYGITWTEAVGPMAGDPETFKKAVEIHKDRIRDWKNGYRWPGGWEACAPIKDALGSKAWKNARMEAMRTV